MNAENPMGDEELRRRLAEAEAENVKLRAERDEYKSAAYSFLGQIIPYTTPTEEELKDMLEGPRGQPILEIIAELEAGLNTHE